MIASFHPAALADFTAIAKAITTDTCLDLLLGLSLSVCLDPASMNRDHFAQLCEMVNHDQESVQHAIIALSGMLVDATRRDLSVEQFRVAAIDMRLPDELAQRVCHFYADQSAKLSAIVETCGQAQQVAQGSTIPRFSDLRWRVQVETATRMNHKVANPCVLLALECKDAQQNTETTHLQADFSNVKHMLAKLREALDQQTKDVHTQRIQRYVK